MDGAEQHAEAQYEIVIRGCVQGAALAAFDGFRVVPGDPGETRFRGQVSGPTELQRVLRRVAAGNLPLLSVELIASDAAGS